MKLKLERPIVFFDLEATGINVRRDRIVEICVIKLMPDGERITRTRLINPEIPIPQAAIDIHGITNDDVRDAPPFRQVAQSFFDFLQGCDFGGFHIIKFDIPMLTEEFGRADLMFSVDGCRLIDAQRIYHRKEPRTLTAALRFYCNEDHTGAHSSESDVEATMKVLEAQLEHYADLPNTVDGLHEYCNPTDPNFIDKEGKLRWQNGEVVIGFGQKFGMDLRTLATSEPGYLKWIMRGDFNADVKRIVGDAIAGTFLRKPEKK